MPRIDITYTPNLAGKLDVAGFVDAVHTTALDTGVFQGRGIRTMARATQASRIGDGPDRGYIQVDVRIAPGRPREVVQRVLDRFDEVVSTWVTDLDHHHLRYQIDLTEFDEATCRAGGDE